MIKLNPDKEFIFNVEKKRENEVAGSFMFGSDFCFRSKSAEISRCS
jgi:hypothetical protein